MAKLEMIPYDGCASRPRTMAKVTLSRRNLLALLHKLDMQGSNRRIENNCVSVDGEHTFDTILVLCCEDDAEHYADPDRLGSCPGRMVHETETFIRETTT